MQKGSNQLSARFGFYFCVSQKYFMRFLIVELKMNASLSIIIIAEFYRSQYLRNYWLVREVRSF